MDSFSSHRHAANSVEIDPRRTAVVVVDMSNDFCKDGGLMVLPGAERLYAPQRAVIDATRSAGGVVVFVCDSHRHGMRREREFMKRTPHCWADTWGSAVVDELAPRVDDHIVLKRRYSGFFQTDLDLTLKDMEVDTLIMMGVVTNICVRSTVHDAFFLGYRVVVPQDCVAATGPREQESSLYDIGTHFGVVSHSAAVVAALADGRPVANEIDD